LLGAGVEPTRRCCQPPATLTHSSPLTNYSRNLNACSEQNTHHPHGCYDDESEGGKVNVRRGVPQNQCMSLLLNFLVRNEQERT